MLAGFGGLVVVHDQSTVVEEVIHVIITRDESVALLLVEHFDCSLHETPNLPSSFEYLTQTNRESLYHHTHESGNKKCKNAKGMNLGRGKRAKNKALMGKFLGNPLNAFLKIIFKNQPIDA